MPEEQGGQQQEGQEQQQQEGGEQQAEGEQQEQERRPASRTYSQEEVDRIVSKAKKNSRYLGRKEAEASFATRPQQQQQQQQESREEPKGPPKREDFENYEDYLVAKADHAARQASREEREASEKAARERTVSEQRAKIDRDFSKVAREVVAENPEIAEAIESAENVMITDTMGDAIKEAGRTGVHVLHFLVENPDEADRISQLSHKAQLREIGKLEARIEAELEAKKKAKPDAEEGTEEQGEQEGEEREESGAEAKGEDDKERNRDGTFKSAKKRAAPDPIEPGTARAASGTRTASDKDDVNTWMRKENERAAREGRR